MSEASVLLGGVDVGALVFDIGNHSLRAGHAGEDCPRHEIPAVVGVCEDTDGDSAAAIDGMDGTRYYVDTTFLDVPRKGMEVVSYMKDGVIDEWDLFEKVLDYTYSKCIRSESKSYPVLMSEPPWNPKNKREQLTEIMFEKYDVPAFFLVKNAVLATFASGRATALVVDSGATHTSAVPVQDGFALTKEVVKSPLGGDYISAQCKQLLQDGNIEVVPIYMIGSKQPVKEKVKANWTKKNNIPEVTTSWHNYMVKKVIQDFQSCVLQVSEKPYYENNVAAMTAVRYEFPHGYHQRFGVERFRIPEALFSPIDAPVGAGVGGSTSNTNLGVGHFFTTSVGMSGSTSNTNLGVGPFFTTSVGMSGSTSNANLGVSQLVTTSVGQCDPDIRPALYGSVVLTGGNSVMRGFPERLIKDLSIRIPSGMRAKLISANGSAERKFGSWIGGSIVASSGTFQEVWMSSQEYFEAGKGQVHTKCP